MTKDCIVIYTEHQPEGDDLASSTIDRRKISESIEQYRQAAVNAIRAGITCFSYPHSTCF